MTITFCEFRLMHLVLRYRTHTKTMFLKFPRIVWLSLFPVTLIMALVMAPVILYSHKLCYQLPGFLPWWIVDVMVLAVWSLMFGSYIVWITVRGMEYRQSSQEG